MTNDSILNKTFGLSLLLHGALLALLVLVGIQRPIHTDSPLRVRILEPPGATKVPPSTPGPEAAPQVGHRTTAPPPGRFSSDPSIREEQVTKPRVSREANAGDRLGGRDGGAKGPESSERTKGVELAPPPLPQVAARSATEPIIPPAQRLPEPSRDVPPITAPERSGLTLGGPRPGVSVLPPEKSAPPSGGTRRSLRDQIASLGSGLSGDTGELAKQTLPLDSRDPVYLPYLDRLKRRIQNEWVYPEEAWSRGVSGELLLVFTLNKNGSLTNVRLVHSSGFPILDQEALRAVKQAAPYDPFPPQMGEEPWNITASFHYFRFRRN